MLPKIVAIVGPTASGKSALGMQLAKRFDGEILSVDSRQIYRGMDIGTAKEKDELGTDLVDPNQDYNVMDFKVYALRTIDEILERRHLPILVGGTGLWLQAIIDNLDLTQTAPDPTLRSKLEAKSLDELVAEYLAGDPEGADIVDLKNKRRVIRALEVTLKTGKPFSQQLSRGEPKYDVLQIGLLVDRDELKARIDRRVDEMMSAGFLDEVRALQKKYPLTIGYRELRDHLDGRTTLDEAIAKIKTATHQFAKRQMTWFKRDPRIQWIKNPNEADPLVRLFLKNVRT